MLLLTGAAFMGRSIGLMSRFDRGFDTDPVTIGLRLRGEEYATPEARLAFMRRAGEELGAIAGVESSSLSDRLPGVTPPRARALEIDGRPSEPSSLPRVEPYLVGADFFASLAIPIRAGRSIGAADVDEAAPVAVVTSALAQRHWPDSTPVGTRVRLEGGDWLTIVGVSANVSRAWNEPRPAMAIYRPYTLAPPAAVQLTLAGAHAVALLPAARERIWRIDPGLPLTEARTIEEAIAEHSRLYWPIISMASGFAAAAFLLSVAGIYSVISYAAARRSWEMGVRMALGAGHRDVRRLFVKQALWLAGLGLVVGLPAAWMLTRALAAISRGQLTTGSSLSLLAPLSIAVLVSAALAAWLPARRAASGDPVDTLRTE